MLPSVPCFLQIWNTREFFWEIQLIIQQGFVEPTAIQAQGIPAVMMGRDQFRASSRDLKYPPPLNRLKNPEISGVLFFWDFGLGGFYFSEKLPWIWTGFYFLLKNVIFHWFYTVNTLLFPAPRKRVDVIGLAKTGSGKTAAFLSEHLWWPMITHILQFDHLQKGDGPIAIHSR